MMQAPVAYAPSIRLARRHYENFPVASRLLPPGMRPHIAAIYAFARTADDFADEPGIADADRLRLLDEWERALVDADAPHRLRVPGDVDAVRVFEALHQTIEACELPVQPFRDLISAFRQDVTKHRYATWTDLLDYCRRSADPVGRLVLRVAGHRDAALDRMSDAVCTALQLTNMWQDLDRDWRNGRLYVPLEDRARMGAREEDLDARLLTPEWRAMLAVLAQRTRELFDAGRGVCDGVHGRLRWELRLTWLGGRRVLEKLERRGFDVFTRRPTIGILDLPVLLAGAANWPVRPTD
jgi:squalene synthase HpnC